jgi:hypothetical protein
MKTTPIPGSPETQFDGIDRSDAPYYKKLASGLTAKQAFLECKMEAAKSAGISLEEANRFLAEEAE